ncbi:MAG: AAA domain-containing protein [Ktedonobacterales bacterium]
MFRRARTTGMTNHDTAEGTAVSPPERGGLTPVGQWPDATDFFPPMPSGAIAGVTEFSPLFAGVCRYYHDCFSADSRGGILTNVLDKNQAEYLTFANASDVVLTGQASQLEMPLATAVTAQNAADVNRREKFLIYGSIFLVGRGHAASAKRKGELYCAPLLYWPARIEHEGSQAWLVVELDEQRINFPLLASLIDAENEEQAQAYAEAILAQVPSAPFDVEAVREFSSVVGELIPDLRTDDLLAWPEVQSEEAVRDLIEHDSPVQLLCASAMALVRRPTEARGVLTELQEMGNRGDMSEPLAAIFGNIAVGGSTSSSGRTHRDQERAMLCGAELSYAQARVLRQAEHRPLTLVIGPPGTGKSFTIAQIILDAVARGQTVLLSSKMNKAVDVVVEKLQPHLGSLTVILRGGDKRYRDELKQFLDNLFDGTGAPSKPRPGEIEMLEERLSAVDLELAHIQSGIIELLGAESQWVELAGAFADIAAPHYDEEAAERAGPEEIRRWREELRKLNPRKMAWFSGRKREQLAAEVAAALGVRGQDLEEIEAIIQRESARANLALLETELAEAEEVNALLTRHARLRTDRGAIVGELLSIRRRDTLAEALRLNRRTLSLFKTALEARSTAEQDKIFAELDFAALLNTFPIWAVTNPHAAELLPLQREMFDLVIVDEASQCDVSSALPLLYRAKRAIVCGDPKQLRHLSWLREDRQAALASQHGLSASQRSQWNYRTHSLLDVVNGALPSQDDVVLLDEHYRSLPQIIEFSNRRFYGTALRIMTRRPDTIGLRSLELRKINGRREKSGHNVAEAEAIVNEINKIARTEAKLAAADKSSIGVLSPYRDQVNYLSRTLAAKLKSRVLQDHDITVGTAHTFQGDERDVMLISFCADPTSHRSTVTFLNNENLFNVAITRARRRQVIYTALDPRHLPVDHLLREYLIYATECLEEQAPESLSDAGTTFERAVAEELAQHAGYTVYRGYPVAGFSIDVVAARGRQALAIACDGDPERLPAAAGTPSLDSIAGQTILERAGWRVHRVPYRRWLLDRDSCLEEIDALLGGEEGTETVL